MTKILAKRRVTQVKASHKGKKGLRGQPLFYDEVKSSLKTSLTPTAIAWWEKLAQAEGCSISEAMERTARGALKTQQLAPVS